MAEFPDLGKQCSKCKTLDFLPLVCNFCKEVFCKDHHSVVVHNCPQYDSNTADPTDSVSILGKCAFCRQSVPDTELVLCNKCEANHCLTHRHYDSHRCPKNKTEVNITKPVIAMPLTNTSGPNVKGTKNKDLALKVALMKLKQKASGQTSLPLDERLYFKVNYQKNQNLESKDVFLSREWSVGKCIDWLSSHLSLVNNNNNPLVPKLVLSSDSTYGQIFSMSKTLKELETEGILHNGDTVCLKYIQ